MLFAGARWRGCLAGYAQDVMAGAVMRHTSILCIRHTSILWPATLRCTHDGKGRSSLHTADAVAVMAPGVCSFASAFKLIGTHGGVLHGRGSSAGFLQICVHAVGLCVGEGH